MPRSRSLPTEVVARPGSGRATFRKRKRSRARRLWSRVRWPLLALGTLALAAAIDIAVRYVPAAQALQHGRDKVTQAQSLLTGDLAHLDQARLARAEAMLTDAQKDFGERSAVLADGWLGGVGAHLPWVGSQMEATRSLRTAGEDGTAAGAQVVHLVQVLVPGGAASDSLLQRLASVAGQHSDELDSLASRLSALKADIASLPDGSLLAPLESARQTLRRQAANVISTAGPAITLLKALPAAIGPGTHTYLILLENPGEVRPGGGFIGAVGQLTFTDGAITQKVFRDSTFTNPFLTNMPAPRPLRTYPKNNLPWQMNETAWSPDFPHDVADAETFYTAATGVHPDGAIAVDPIALGGVLTITGPLTVPPYPQVVTGANALTELNYIANQARPGDPGKVFLPPFGQAVTDRLLHATLGEAPALASSLAVSAQQKHILLYFSDPKLELLARGADFDGGVRAPLGDSLQVLDANLSGTKGDLRVTRDFHLTVAVGADGQAHDRLSLNYHNPPVVGAANQAINAASGGAYRDYIQVLIPETAQLDSIEVSVNREAPQQVSPEAFTYDYHLQGIAYWLIVPAAGSATVVFTYEGPFADISRSPATYNLSWQRQNSVRTWPIDVTISLPGREVQRFAADLSIDRSWSLTAGR